MSGPTNVRPSESALTYMSSSAQWPVRHQWCDWTVKCMQGQRVVDAWAKWTKLSKSGNITPYGSQSAGRATRHRWSIKCGTPAKRSWRIMGRVPIKTMQKKDWTYFWPVNINNWCVSEGCIWLCVVPLYNSTYPHISSVNTCSYADRKGILDICQCLMYVNITY